MIQTAYINIHSHASEPNVGEFTLRSAFPWEVEELKKAGFSNLSVGLHPWHVHREDAPSLWEQLEHLAQDETVDAIGETGLDRFAEAPLTIQEAYFLRHAKLAEQLNKPLIIHCVRCYPELLQLKKQLNPTVPWIIHGFRGNHQTAQELIRHDCFLSFGEALINGPESFQKTFQNVPNERFFLETDESKVSIREIYLKAALLRDASVEEIRNTIYNNTITCFRRK